MINAKSVKVAALMPSTILIKSKVPKQKEKWVAMGLVCQAEEVLVVNMIGILSAVDLPVRADVSSLPPPLFVNFKFGDDATGDV